MITYLIDGHCTNSNSAQFVGLGFCQQNRTFIINNLLLQIHKENKMTKQEQITMVRGMLEE
jgi:hypothetical protein